MKFKNMIMILFSLIILLVINIIILSVGHSDFITVFLLSLNLIFPIIVLFLKFNNSIMFDPVNLFSIFYIFIPITGYYFSFSDLKTNQYIYNVTFYNDIYYLFKLTLFFCLIFYLLFVITCEMVLKSKYNKPNFKINIYNLNFRLLYFLALAFGLVGFSNLIFNIITTTDGNIVLYIQNIVSRSKEFKDNGTTILYHFSYISIYLYVVFLYCTNMKLRTNFMFYILLLITIFMKFSTGRITNTLFFMMSIIALSYILKLNKNHNIENSRYYLSLLPLGIFGVLFYSFRIVSSYLSYGMSMNFFTSVKMVIDDFGYYAIDKGNLPNLPVIMKIIDSWENDIGYLWGKSYLSILQSISNNDFVTRNFPIVSIKVKETWYSNTLGGALPPSIMGEAYANFGILGIIIFPIIFGLIVGIFYKYVLIKKNIWLHIICIQILVGFIFIAPKVESTNLSPWFIIPTLFAYLTYSVLNIGYKGLEKNRN